MTNDQDRAGSGSWEAGPAVRQRHVCQPPKQDGPHNVGRAWRCDCRRLHVFADLGKGRARWRRAGWRLRFRHWWHRPVDDSAGLPDNL